MRLLGEELLGYAGAFGGVLGIPSGAHGVGVVWGQHGASHEGLGVGYLLAQKLDGLLHRLHGSGHQRRKADKTDILLERGIYHNLRVHIAA